MDKISGVYEIVNIFNGSKYIGSSVNVPRRLARHRCNLRKGEHENTHLQRAWSKYGEGGFTCNILLLCDPQNTLMYEQLYIDCMHPEYNIAICTGATWLGLHHTIETRAKMSVAKKAMSAETRAKMSAAKKAISAETRAKMRLAQMGNTNSLGHKHTEDAKAKMSMAKKAMYAKTSTKLDVASP